MRTYLTVRYDVTGLTEHQISELEIAAVLGLRYCPNARDYTQGPDAAERATKQHQARVARLREIQYELQLIWEGIQDQTD